MANIDKNNKIFKTLLDDYKRTKSFLQSRIRQDRNSEDTTCKDYCGRELYELLQNAEDEHSEYVNIILNKDNCILKVQNGGDNCKPFSEEGFCSIMMSGMSPKKASKERKQYIGNKGLGFRSILNWANAVSIVSAGVKCSFSLEIAKKYWEEIKKGFDDKLIKEHENFSKEAFNTECPLAILAIPEVENCKYEDFTTSIEIKYKESSFDNIKRQIESLSGKVLLFLKNIKKISITIVNDKSYEIIKEKEENIDNNGFIAITIRDKNHSEGQEWIVWHQKCDYQKDEQYGIGIAYDIRNHESGEYIYSFFPTQIRIPLPCVIHATFELTSSRNEIIKSEANNDIKKQIAKMLLEFAEHMAERASLATPTWEFHDILTMKDNHDLADLEEFLERKKEEKNIYPTLSAGYIPLKDSCHYSDAWADFVKGHDLQNQFPNHLLKGFKEKGIEQQAIDPDFFDKVNEYSKQLDDKDQQFENRCDLICAVTTIPAGVKKLQLLVDENGRLISGEAHMNVGESISYLPEAINISYVNTSLADRLIEKLKITESNAMRGLTRKLNAYTKVTDMDVSQAKRKIVSYTKNNMELDGYKQLLFALFSKYTESDKGHDYVKEIASNPEFNLLDMDGNKHYPSELVLVISDIQSYPNKFLLLRKLYEWKQIFNEFTSSFNSWKSNIQDDEIKDFFYSALGVSSIVPMVCIPIDEKANDYISRYASSYTIVNNSAAYYTKNLGDEHNRYKVISEEFCDSYINSHSLLDLIKLIIGNKELFEELNNRQLHYRYRSIKRETARKSYAQYLMSKYDCLKDVRSFVVSESLYLGEDENVGNALRAIVATHSENTMIPYADRLIILGAKKDLSTILVDELFKILLELPDMKLTQGIQKIYRALREALKKHEETELFRKQCAEFKEKGKVYARVGSNIEVRPVKEVYYWDNDQLPKHILANLPKLEIGSRVGEDSVKTIFGVNLTKDIEIRLNSGSQEEKELSDTLNKYFRERLRYLLSYRILNTKENANAIKTYSNHLKNTKFKVYTTCTFNYNDESVKLKNGDMISSKTEQDTIFHICTSHTVFGAAIKDPKFCENITEAICIVLQVTGSEITSCFRSIINQSIEYTKFISEKEISKEDLDNADKALGISEREKTFWEKVFNLAGKKINLDKLSMLASDKQEYLREKFPDIELPTPLKDVHDMEPAEKYRLALSLSNIIKGFDATVFGNDTMLKDYYSLWWDENQFVLEQKFASWAYMHIDELKGDEQQLPPYRFYDACKACMEFVKGKWAETIVSEEEILDNDKLNNKLIALAKEAYPNFEPQNQVSVHLEIRPEYKKILNEHKLTPDNIYYRDIYLTYFEGEQYLEKFRKEVENRAKQIDGEEMSDQENVSAVICYGEAQTIKTSDSKNGSLSGGRYKTDRELKRTGLNAEQLVFKTMDDSKDKFYDVKGCSRNIGSITGDSNHYDIQYKKTGENEVRYLEVKAIGQDSIIMSKAEYDFAIKHKERYDFALVRGNQITIVETPFLQSGNHQALEVFPESYKVPLKVTLK